MKIQYLLLFTCFIPFYTMAQDFSKIDEILKDYDGSKPGAALAIIRDGKVIYSKGYGLSDLESHQKVTDQSNFRLASVTKQFTAAAILQLIERGKLSLKTKLNDCFDALPSYATTINIRQMLNHTSGILDYDDFIDESEKTAQLADADVLKACRSFSKTYFEPGTTYRYSNTAYVLLGLIIEKYSGMPYSDYLAKHIFKPLKMKNTIAYVKGVNEISHRAYGYGTSQGKWIRKDQSSTSATLGDGGIYSNLKDLTKWDAALYLDKILPKKVWLSAFEQQSLKNGTKIAYGFGWHLKQSSSGQAIVYHTGSTTSFRNVFYRIPEEKLSLILLTNRNTPEETEMTTLAEKILSKLIF
ncbi:serine hydrolase domain-containing protein [Pedobacter insulae]|uniref:CubicO group peptidase, beta-lactamase class C family n=1 Tax=Pedobacter insulae TaxID=414048 RepID=A0A1I2XSJ7_9SPHI|nr:serine hydrolase domain-containing protein [Pedobacter insulae]SFH16420.1 CubicO group peptidase, beta-lactamase class C family [Pedobacter insulae]